ncbi:hypothetical protein K3172_11365 [Qipengyuania sp. 6B39]|uniref:calcium-binding protein n=1 Tax=Qipengyuania proteolytica TaxID=2867239 RepID=UPI001C893A6D|nr:calcium-binding protein [Qipengyuania proteolytica]MBX7496453.1 hypothetical protein [Qipengyuania proteolytica]
MAIFTAVRAFDAGSFIANANIAEFFDFATPSGNSSRVTFTDVFDGITERLIIDGSFANFVDGVPTTGTITGLDYSITGGAAFTFQGLSMSVEQFTNFVGTDDTAGLFAALLAGADTINGSAFADRLQGLEGNDTIEGLGGDDVLEGGNGADLLRGGGGNDILDGGAGADSMFGGGGNDTYYVDNAGDVVTELAGAGTDTVYASISYEMPTNVEVLHLSGGRIDGTGNPDDNTIYGNDVANVLVGRNVDDTLYAGSGADQVYGGRGTDVLYGDGGADFIVGGKDDDIIYGGGGLDKLVGALGADTFAYASTDDAGLTQGSSDIIADFDQAEGDLIDLSGIDADSSTAGTQHFTFIGQAAFSGAAGELRYSQGTSRTIVEMDTDGDGSADAFIWLDGILNLTQSDFTADTFVAAADGGPGGSKAFGGGDMIFAGTLMPTDILGASDALHMV